MQLEGKNVIYIGGFGGIGSKCAEAFLSKGVKSLLILDWTPNDECLQFFQETYKNSYVDYILLDLTKFDTIVRAFKQAKKMIGYFDIVVNGAGSVLDNNIDMVMQINLTGLIHSCLEAMEYMSKANGGPGGMIINVSSTAGLRTYEFASAYGSAKSAVNKFTRSMALPIYFDQTGVNFIAVIAGLTENPLSNIKGAKYSSDTLKEISGTPQNARALAINLMRVVQTAKNGTTWILEDDEMHEIEYPKSKRIM